MATPDDSEFEAPILELEKQIDELTDFGEEDEKRQKEIQKLQVRLDKLRREIYAKLTPWQKVLVARNPNRPYTLDYLRYLFKEFVELHGDRGFADDPAIVGGFAQFGERPVMVIGHQKGRDTKEKIHRNFGMPRPEGYRKALRLMNLAEKFHRPVITFIDTPGAYPGLGAEERGQAEAIARNLREMAGLRVPILVVVAGEGGSGGALALGVGDRINMLEHSTYSVISPEGCAAILWRDDAKKKEAAATLRLTAQELMDLGLLDEIVPETPGGAHASPADSAALLGEVLERQLEELELMDIDELLDARHLKFRRMGRFQELG
jgi:acetyl-CoA carboxylase carboxyl transferase subunit alpha